MGPRNILFLCDDNAAGSLMAEAIVNGSRSREFKAFSAGFEPAEEADPAALEIIAQAGLRVPGLHPKSWCELLDAQMDFDYAVSLVNGDRPELASLRGNERFLEWPVFHGSSGSGGGASRKAEYLSLFAEIRQLAEATFLRPARNAPSGGMSKEGLSLLRSRGGSKRVSAHELRCPPPYHSIP